MPEINKRIFIPHFQSVLIASMALCDIEISSLSPFAIQLQQPSYALPRNNPYPDFSSYLNLKRECRMSNYVGAYGNTPLRHAYPQILFDNSSSSQLLSLTRC